MQLQGMSKAKLDHSYTDGNMPNTLVAITNGEMRAYTLALLALSLLATGCGVYCLNHSLQIPLINLLNNPSMYPNDPFAATLPKFGSMLWRAVAWIARDIPLVPLLISLFVLERLLVIYAAGKAAQAFAPRSKLAVLGSMSLFALAPASLLAQGTVVTYYFEQTGLAIAFVLLGFAAFQRQKPLQWAISLAVVFNLQSMYGTYALTYFAASLLADPVYRKQWKKWALALGLFLVLSIPNILLTLSDFGKGTTDNALWVTAAKLRFAPHLYPLTWGKSCFFWFGVVTLLTLGAVYQNRRKISLLPKHAALWAAVSAVWILYAFIAARLGKPSMLVMQPGRATDIWCCVTGVAIVSACATRFESSKEHRFVLLAGVVASVLMWQFNLIAALIITISIFIGAWNPVWTITPPSGIRVRATAIILVVVALTATYSFGRRASITGNAAEALILPRDTEVIQIAEWAKANTPMNAVFLIDLSWSDFRALSERPVFTTWKDGSGILWDRPFVSEWVTRLSAVGVDINNSKLTNANIGAAIERANDYLNDQRVKRIAERYPIRYWVVSTAHESNFPVVFHNRSYKVLKLGNQGTAPR